MTRGPRIMRPYRQARARLEARVLEEIGAKDPVGPSLLQEQEEPAIGCSQCGGIVGRMICLREEERP
jgi:hypothetical protein